MRVMPDYEIGTQVRKAMRPADLLRMGVEFELEPPMKGNNDNLAAILATSPDLPFDKADVRL
jgi:hypothetical protein